MVSGEIMPTMLNLGRMIGSAYKGWISPETTSLTGIAPTPAFGKNLLSLGKPEKIINGVRYYKNEAGELKTAQEIAKEITNVGSKLASKIGKVKPRTFNPKKRGVYDLLSHESREILNNDGYFNSAGEWVNRNGINWDSTLYPIWKPKYADDIDNAFLMEKY